LKDGVVEGGPPAISPSHLLVKGLADKRIKDEGKKKIIKKEFSHQKEMSNSRTMPEKRKNPSGEEMGSPGGRSKREIRRERKDPHVPREKKDSAPSRCGCGARRNSAIQGLKRRLRRG